MGEFERVNRDDSDLSITVDLKAVAAKKMRLYVTGYFQGEYMYMLGKDRLIMNYKEYSVNKQKTVTASQVMVARPYIKKEERIILVLEKKKKKKNIFW